MENMTAAAEGSLGFLFPIWWGPVITGIPQIAILGATLAALLGIFGYTAAGI